MRTLEVEDVIWRLAQLASAAFQDRYVVNGSVDSYFRDDELLQDIDALEFRLFRPENANLLDEQQMAAVQKVLGEVRGFDWPAWQGSRSHHTVLTYPAWIQLRLAANHALNTFGLDAERMTASDVDAMGR